jgi:hypothetical protein
MLILGLLLLSAGLAALVYGFMQYLKAARVVDAPLARTGDAASRGPVLAGPRGAISVEGDVVCPQPLVAPVSGTPCLFYEVTCTVRSKEREGRRKRRGEEPRGGTFERVEQIASEKVAAEFSIDDGSGPIRIEADQGGSFEPKRQRKETKGTGLLGGLTGTELEFGRYRVSTRAFSLGATYTVVETLLPLQERLYVCGKATLHRAIGSPDWRRLIVSGKSRDELLDSARHDAKRFLTGGALALAVGAALALLGS